MYQYLSSNTEDIRGFKLIRLFFYGGALILLGWFLYFAFSTIMIPYQIEYREGAAQVMTQFLLAGKNPFSLEHQPLGMNNYGIGYNLFVLPLATLFGNTLIVHRSVSFVFLFASALLVAKTIWTLKQDVLISVVSGIFIIVPLAGIGGLGAFPSTTGAFLFLAAILLPFLYSFRYPSLIVSVLLSIIAYYTKPYFVIGFGVVAIYTFVFISKQKGIMYSLFFLAVFGIFFLGVTYISKLYFIDTFISNLSNTARSPAHLYRQLLELGREFFPSILVGIALLFFQSVNTLSHKHGSKSFSIAFGVFQLHEPLIHMPVNYFAYTFIFCFLVFVLVLGQHWGSYMTYAYQIVVPPFVLWLFQAVNSKNRFSIVAFCLLLGNILMLENILLNPNFLRQSDSAAWRDLYGQVINSRHIVNSPAVVSALIDAGISPVDSGQTEYYYGIQPYSDNKLVGPSYETIKTNGITYLHSIQDAIKNHEFDKIFTTERYRNLITLDIISRYYTQVDTISIDMPQTRQTWVIKVWEPTGK